MYLQGDVEQFAVNCYEADIWRHKPNSSGFPPSLSDLLVFYLKAHLYSTQDTDGAVHVHPAFILCVFSYIFRELADAYPNAANGARPLKIVGQYRVQIFSLVLDSSTCSV